MKKIVILSFLFLLLLGFFVFIKKNANVLELMMFYKNRNTQSQPKATVETVSLDTKNWKTYTNKKEGYSVKYPDSIYLVLDPNNADSIVFSNNKDVFVSKNQLSFVEQARIVESTSSLRISVSLPFDRDDLQKDVSKRSSNISTTDKKLIFNNIDAIESEIFTGDEKYQLSSNTSYYMRAKNGNVYAIKKIVGNQDSTSNSVFMAMLSTFTRL